MATEKLTFEDFGQTEKIQAILESENVWNVYKASSNILSNMEGVFEKKHDLKKFKNKKVDGDAHDFSWFKEGFLEQNNPIEAANFEIMKSYGEATKRSGVIGTFLSVVGFNLNMVRKNKPADPDVIKKLVTIIKTAFTDTKTEFETNEIPEKVIKTEKNTQPKDTTKEAEIEKDESVPTNEKKSIEVDLSIIAAAVPRKKITEFCAQNNWDKIADIPNKKVFVSADYSFVRQGPDVFYRQSKKNSVWTNSGGNNNYICKKSQLDSNYQMVAAELVRFDSSARYEKGNVTIFEINGKIGVIDPVVCTAENVCYGEQFSPLKKHKTQSGVFIYNDQPIKKTGNEWKKITLTKEKVNPAIEKKVQEIMTKIRSFKGMNIGPARMKRIEKRYRGNSLDELEIYRENYNKIIDAPLRSIKKEPVPGMPAGFYKINAWHNDFDPESLVASDKKAIVIFSTKNCPPCRALFAKLKKDMKNDSRLAKKYEVFYVTLNVDQDGEHYDTEDDLNKINASFIAKVGLRNADKWPTIFLVNPSDKNKIVTPVYGNKPDVINPFIDSE